MSVSAQITVKDSCVDNLVQGGEQPDYVSTTTETEVEGPGRDVEAFTEDHPKFPKILAPQNRFIDLLVILRNAIGTLNERIKALEGIKVPTEQNYKIDVLLASFDAKMKARDYIDLSYTGDVSACEKCKVESPASFYCGECGAKRAVATCGSCCAIVRTGAKYCSHCGARVIQIRKE